MNLYEYFKGRSDILMKEDEASGLASVKYLHMGVDWSAPFMLDARGLVINKEGEVIGRPYEKFFNYHQLSEFTSLPDSIRDLSRWTGELDYLADKSDGSLVIAYTYKDELFLSSSGSVSGIYPDLFKELLMTKYPKSTYDRLLALGRTFTISMEYVAPDNKIVIEYKEPKFILHGARNTKTGAYLSLSELKELSKYLGIELMEVYEGKWTPESTLEFLSSLKNKEGFVATFKDGKKLKFKTEEYIRLHSVSSLINFTDKTRLRKKLTYFILEDTLDDILSEIRDLRAEEKEEVTKEIDELLSLYTLAIETLTMKHTKFKELNLTRKDFARTLTSSELKVTQSALFSLYKQGKGDLSDFDWVKDRGTRDYIENFMLNGKDHLIKDLTMVLSTILKNI